MPTHIAFIAASNNGSKNILRTNALEGLACALELEQKSDRDNINEIKDMNYSCRG
jgi:hypothetical protein